MKKYILGAVLLLAPLATVSAQEMGKGEMMGRGGEGRGAQMREGGNRGGMMASSTGMNMPRMNQPTITTGDAAIDAQIANLQKEMEAKMKAIADEYKFKIDTLTAGKTIKITGGRPEGMDRPMMNASGTATGTRGMMPKGEGREMGMGDRQRPQNGQAGEPQIRKEQATGLINYLKGFLK